MHYKSTYPPRVTAAAPDMLTRRAVRLRRAGLKKAEALGVRRDKQLSNKAAAEPEAAEAEQQQGEAEKDSITKLPSGRSLSLSPPSPAALWRCVPDF